jgi:hypothetical protein
VKPKAQVKNSPQDSIYQPRESTESQFLPRQDISSPHQFFADDIEKEKRKPNQKKQHFITL